MTGTGLLNLGMSRCEVVANVPRSFFCAAQRKGVRPEDCQACWRRNQAPEHVETHTTCIDRYRVIALWAFDRKPLDPVERAIWDLVKFRARGIENAITSSQIQTDLATEARGGFHLSDDVIRRAVREMKQKGFLIISSNSGKGVGFFFPVRDEEVLKFLGTQKSRKDAIHASMLATARFLHCKPDKLRELGLSADSDLDDRVLGHKEKA